MRDPDGEIYFTEEHVERIVKKNFDGVAFLKSGTAEKLSKDGLLVNYRFLGDAKLQSNRYPFITYPHEWSDKQLLDSANLTLKISELIYSDSYELKDASAYNIIFIGTSPIFCDLLSFQKISSRLWWAFGQFCRNFIFPLTLSKHKKLHCYEIFSLSRDGISVDKIKSLLSFTNLFSRIAPLIYAGIGKNYSVSKGSKFSNTTSSYHESLYTYCKWVLPKMLPKRNRSHWVSYVDNREHYKEIELKQKYDTVKSWLRSTSPNWVLDMGCNTGEYAEIAASLGANVIATDFDHDCIENLYLNTQYPLKMHPLICNWSDLIGGKGFLGGEHSGILDRVSGVVDLTMMLALIHHLIINNSIPVAEIAGLANKINSKFLILETVSSDDEMVKTMLAQRPNVSLELCHESQLNAFREFYDVMDSIRLGKFGRQIHLLRKK